ncbi:MAG TPA: DUF3857 domain-containing protein, partial [Candidatus Sulfotelmatobacter sp.]|nr:DUF3857 domain-containing protein [Candidatus Sulfotelmatobacter sp.]
GLEGILVETEAQVQTHSLYYQQWYCATNGFAYQLTAYGRAGERQRLAADLRTLFSRFEILDPRRVAVVAGSGFATNFVSARYGYAVSLTNSPWRPYASLEKQAPEAEFGASRGDTCFVVTPVWLGGQRLEADALVSAFLATFGVSYPNEKLTRRRSLIEGDLNGVQYDFTREVQGMPFSYRFKLLQGNGDGFLVAAWTQRREAEAEAALADALERVGFLPRALPLSTSNRDFSARERKTQGNVLNQAALFYYNSGNYEKALSLFCAAARIQAEESLYVLNALQAWRHLDRPKEALAFLEAQPPASLNLPNIRAWQAYFQAQVSLTEQALTNYAGLFASGFRNDTHFVEYIGLLNLQRQYDQALGEVAAYLKKEDSIPVRLLEAEIYTYKKDFPKALSLLQALHDKVPFNAQVTKNLAEVSLQAGRFNTALEISRELLQQNGDSASAYYYKGRSELGLKWYREAKVSFEAAAKLAPANKDISAYLEHVSGLIGEGSNSAIKEPIEVVALPSALTNTVLEPAPEGYAKSYGAYYLRRATALSWKPRAECKTTESFLAKVLDASGVAAFSTVQFPFDPLSEQVFVNELRVMDAAGNPVSVGKVADYYVLDDPSGTVASQKKVLNIPVPGLQPGGQLAVTITRRQLGRLEEFPFLEHTFSRAFPVCESIFYLCGDAAGVTCRTAPALEPCKVAEGRYWRVLDPVVARWESLQPLAATYLPMLWMGDATARWPALASNYLASISDRLELDPALRELARTLTAETPTRDTKIARLTRFVQTNCTYKAIEFGRRARIPNKPAQVSHNQYGDCKDHAVLLQQLLQAVDLPAHLALVSHHAPVRQDLPSLDQFDHMIVFVPEVQGGRFIDCTLKGADAARDIPLGLAGREVLILQSQNPHFATIPGYAEGASTCDLQRRLQLVNLTDVA